MNVSSPNLSWRLVHNGTAVISLQHSTGRTRTIRTLFEAGTKAEVAAEVERLGLTLPAELEAVLAPTLREQLIALFATLPGDQQERYLPAFEALQPAMRAGKKDMVHAGLLNITVSEPEATAVRNQMLTLTS